MNRTQKRRLQNNNSTKSTKSTKKNIKNVKNIKNKNNYKYKSCKSKMYNSLYGGRCTSNIFI